MSMTSWQGFQILQHEWDVYGYHNTTYITYLKWHTGILFELWVHWSVKFTQPNLVRNYTMTNKKMRKIEVVLGGNHQKEATILSSAIHIWGIIKPSWIKEINVLAFEAGARMVSTICIPFTCALELLVSLQEQPPEPQMPKIPASSAGPGMLPW